MKDKIEEDAKQLLIKFRELKGLEKERDKIQEELKEINGKISHITIDMDGIIHDHSGVF